MNKSYLSFLSAGFTVFMLLTVPSAQAQTQLLDQVIAVVNDEAITQSELDSILRPIYEDYKQRYSGDKLFRELNEARTKLLNQLIEDRLVYQEAKEKKVEVDALKIDEQIDSFQKKFPTPVAMEKALNDQGVTLHGLRQRLEKQDMVKSLHDQEVRAKVVVSPSEIEKYFEEHPEKFTSKDRIRVRSLTIKKSDEAREKGLKDEAALEKIHALEESIKAGADFAALAKESSQDVNAKEGGIGDWVERGAMIEAIDHVIFKLKTGETSEVLETAMGYHLFRCEEIQAGSKRGLEDVRDEIYGLIFRDKSEARFNEWLKELKSKAYISVR
jgi:parvulin-like peptidyl-prolyl isomerase